jgi:hypothetical protein
LDDEEDSRPYSVEEIPEEDDDEKAEKLPHFGSIRDKYPKSARGPAMAKMVGPSNYLIFLGLFACIVGIGAFAYGIWPFIFSDTPPTGEKKQEHTLSIIGGILNFIVGGFVCYGSSKMQNLESRGLALATAIVAMVFLSYSIVGILLGLQCLLTINDEEVKKGFEQTANPPKRPGPK